MAWAEKCRARAFERERATWKREQERKEANRWLEEMAGAPGFELW